jgi:hypothetical protein
MDNTGKIASDRSFASTRIDSFANRHPRVIRPIVDCLSFQWLLLATVCPRLPFPTHPGARGGAGT